MELSVHEVAQLRGISPQRVRALVRSGRLNARRVGGQWLIDPADVARPPRVSRPMSNRMAWAMCRMLSGAHPGDLDPSEISRLRARVRALRASDNPAPMVASWLAGRAPRMSLRVDQGALAQVMGDASGADDMLPLGIVVADLADHHGSREDAQVRRLLEQVAP